MKSALLILLTLFAASCTIHKRVHNPGWHVQWKKNYDVSKLEQQERKIRQSNDILIHETQFISGTTEFVDIQKSQYKANSTVFADESNEVYYVVQSGRRKNENRIIQPPTSVKKGEIESQSTIKTKKVKNDKGSDIIATFTWIVVVICTIALAAGICAIIFGQHWAWLVVGILLIVAAVLFLFGYLITLGLGHAVVNEYS